jgi:CTP synthase
LCLGLQMQVIEFARHMAGMKGANSTEMDEKTPYPVIDILPEQKTVKEKGGTMRLGKYECIVKKGTKAHEAYGSEKISERHRHRFEVNPEYVDKLEAAGLLMCGRSPDGKIVEMVEWKDSFGVSTQAHPELKSRLERPAPLFVALLKAALEKKKN